MDRIVANYAADDSQRASKRATNLLIESPSGLTAKVMKMIIITITITQRCVHGFKYVRIPEATPRAKNSIYP